MRRGFKKIEPAYKPLTGYDSAFSRQMPAAGGPPFPDTTNLVAYWAFDGSSASRTETESYRGYDRHGDSTFYSTGTHPANVPGYENNGISGVDTFYTSGFMYYNDALHGAGSIDKFKFLSNFTIAFWIYSPSGTISSWSKLIRVCNTGGTSYNWEVQMSTAPAIYFSAWDTINPPLTAISSAFTQNAWHHILCEYVSAEGKTKVYVDGVKGTDSNSGIGGLDVTQGDTLRCAEGWDSFSGTSQYRIDEMSVWSQLMSAQEKLDLEAGAVLAA